jgi:hypothetical protein
MAIFIKKISSYVFLGKTKWKSIFNFKFIRRNGIGAEGAAKLGERVSKLLKLTSLKLNLV